MAASRRFLPLLLLALLLLASAGLRCWNLREVFIAGQTYFVDPDGYSRMTRVSEVVHHPGTVIRGHLFENWPQGTTPHTTAPFDYLVAALAGLLAPLSPSLRVAIDHAGALVSPLLGLGTLLFLWLWAGRVHLPWRNTMLCAFAFNPILVHGTLLGRPDHQSLQILLLAIALASEARLLSWPPSRRWSALAGAAWGLACWVSIYEPLILLLATLGLVALLAPRSLIARERRIGWGVLAGTLALAFAIEGWRNPVPDPIVTHFFPFWARSIGEMNGAAPWSPLFQRWSWAWLPFTPLLLLWRRDRAGVFWCGLLALTYALTAWQVRWGYFFALVFILSLPHQLAPLTGLLRGWRWAVALFFFLGLWPLIAEWESRFQPSELARRQEDRADAVALRQLADALRLQPPGGVLAPWWFSPALTYWTGFPCVAGSSHQSLPGIVETARFYLTSDPEEALRILDERKVRYVVAYDAERVLGTSAILLGLPKAPPPSPYLYAEWLYARPHSPPPELESLGTNLAFRLFVYKPATREKPSRSSPVSE